MEVLKHGKTRVKQICPKCECEFLYDTKTEIKFHSMPSLGILPSGKAHELAQQCYWYVICPECHEEIKV